MTDTCKISQSAIDLGNDTAKKKYYSTVVNILNEYVGQFNTLDDTRKKIYGMMFEDFTRTGLLTGYDTDALLNCILLLLKSSDKMYNYAVETERIPMDREA